MTDFLGLGAAAIVACTLGILAGGTVKGIVGIGLPLVALPVMASFITVPKAIGLLLLPSFATSVWQTFHGGQFRASVRRLWPFLIGMAAGTWVSARMLASFDARTLYLLLGAIVAIFAAVLYRRLVLSVAPRAEPWAGPAVGAASGLVGGLSMLFGTIYAMYLSGLKLGKEAFVAAVALSNTWATIVLAAAMANFDLLGGADFAGSLLALVPAFAGVLFGTWLRRYIDEERFRKTLAVVLFLIALNLIRKALG
ncbi:MAG TPA: sulfite exporter TauE/SafE family protein [Burkholderiales bacterium]|nr:sulfite exporter TauE/SafE family protein [Burkholderiales bacterium]